MNNSYSSVTVNQNTPTIIASLTVPKRGGYSWKGAIVGGAVDTLIELLINTDVVCAGHITGASPNLILNFGASPYGLIAGQIAMVRATHNSAGSFTFLTTLLMEQL